MRVFGKIIIISLTLLVSVAPVLWAAEEESQPIEKIDVPEAVMKAFTNDYPEMVMTGIETEEIDGVTYYEIELGEGETDVIYLADGTRYSVEQEIAANDLPQKVTDALTASYPDGEITEAEMITRGTVTEFEVVVVIEEEEDELVYEVIVTPDGKIKGDQQILDEDDEEAPGAIDADDEEEED